MAKKEEQKESVTLAWCDSGLVDGKFTQGITDVLLKSGVEFVTALRSQGNQIARQRETVINYWYDNNISDWLLWVDSDVVISPETFLSLWKKKDSLSKPIVTGVYFITNNPEDPLMLPLPAVFSFAEDAEGNFGLKNLHPLPKDSFIKVDAAGMGFVLMHRNVVEKIREKIGEGVALFLEVGTQKTFVGEDIYFFALCGQAEIPVWCDTSATVPHMKRFSFDEHYYNALTKGR